MCNRLPATLGLCIVTGLLAALAGCATSALTTAPAASLEPAVTLTGTIRSGQQPLAAAHVYLFAAATSGYGQPSVSLLTATSTGNADSRGAYVLTDSSGKFTISSGFTCSSSAQVYVYAVGGTNSAAGLLAALGACPTASTTAKAPAIVVNEVTTIAAAYALAGFSTDALHVAGSGTPAAQLGLVNAFAAAANLASLSNGAALSITPGGNGAVPTQTIDTLANILHACAASTTPSSAPCTTLFAAALSNGPTGLAPADTATAAINIAHYPGAQTSTLFRMPLPSTPFLPALGIQPNDFTLGIAYSGGGIAAAYAVAIDAEGDPWFANLNTSSITRLSPVGVPSSPASGYVNGNPNGPVGISVDLGGDVWIVEAVTSTVTKYASSGALLSPSPGYAGGGIQVPQAIASDGLGNVWVANYFGSVSEFNNGGLPVSPAGSGYQGAGLVEPVAIAIDSSGSVWSANAGSTLNSVSKLSSVGMPLSPPTGFAGGGIGRSDGIAIDAQGNAWIANFAGPAGSCVSELSNAGTPLSPSTGFTGGGVNSPFAIAVDGTGNVWTANAGNNSVGELSNAGAPISPPTGYTGGGLSFPASLAIDGSGNVWVANASGATVTELVGAASPVVTPLALGIKNNTLGTRP